MQWEKWKKNHGDSEIFCNPTEYNKNVGIPESLSVKVIKEIQIKEKYK